MAVTAEVSLAEGRTREHAGAWTRASAYYELTKPGITRLVTLTAAVGFYLAAPGGIDIGALIATVVGVALASSGAAALNQALEHDADSRMLRTQRRPIPSGRVSLMAAQLFALALTTAGVLWLWLLVNAASALLVAATFVSYDFIYTPLKRRTTLSTLVGAVPGALPILAGWAAGGGSLTAAGGWILFWILFLWQIPHFLSLAWLFREDYERGGFVMLPRVDPDGTDTGFQSVNYASALLLASVAPTLLGMTGNIYMIGAILLGAAFLGMAGVVLKRRTNRNARRLLLASVLYLPALLVLMVVDKMPH